MKIPATLMLLLASQVAAADIAERVATGKAALASSKEAREYYGAAVAGPFGAAAKACASNTVPGGWKLTVVGNITATGILDDIEIAPRNSVTTCLVEQLEKAAFVAPPPALAGEKGFPMQLEVMVTDSNSKPMTRLAVIPVFKQLVAFVIPQGFARGFENAAGPNYLIEFVPNGETVEKWTQMISLTGTQDAALRPQMTAATPLQLIAAGFKDICPTSFAARPLGNIKIGEYEGFAAMVGCGTIQKGEPYSEVAFMIAIKGASDIYTIQWAERGTASPQPPDMDDTRWKPRLRQLEPIRICNPVQGETAPYPSCINPQPAK